MNIYSKILVLINVPVILLWKFYFSHIIKNNDWVFSLLVAWVGQVSCARYHLYLILKIVLKAYSRLLVTDRKRPRKTIGQIINKYLYLNIFSLDLILNRTSQCHLIHVAPNVGKGFGCYWWHKVVFGTWKLMSDHEDLWHGLVASVGLSRTVIQFQVELWIEM